MSVTDDSASPVWNYFFQETQKTVRCTLCDTMLKYYGSINNMVAHFKTKHGISFDENIKEGKDNNSQSDIEEHEEAEGIKFNMDSADSTLGKTRKEIKKRSYVWKFFTQDSSTAVRCNICNKFLKYNGSTTNMNTHLKSKHANEGPYDYMSFKRDRKQSSDEEDEDDDYDKPTSSMQTRMTRMAQKRKAEESSTEKLTKDEVKKILLDSRNFLEKANEKLNNETELDVFGKYIAAQLSKLKPEVQLAAQKSIQAILTQYRLDDIEK